jgi:hypothetical protein
MCPPGALSRLLLRRGNAEELGLALAHEQDQASQDLTPMITRQTPPTRAIQQSPARRRGSASPSDSGTWPNTAGADEQRQRRRAARRYARLLTRGTARAERALARLQLTPTAPLDDEQRSRPRHQDYCTRPGFQQSVDIEPMVTTQLPTLRQPRLFVEGERWTRTPDRLDHKGRSSRMGPVSACVRFNESTRRYSPLLAPSEQLSANRAAVNVVDFQPL